MNSLPAGTRVWLAAGATDMRKGLSDAAANLAARAGRLSLVRLQSAAN